MAARDSSDFKEVMASADLVTSDGMPLVWLLRGLGIPDAERVYGPDLMPSVLEAAAKSAIPVGLYGGSAEVLARLIERLAARFPTLNIAYQESPPFRIPTSQEDERTTQAIADAGRANLVRWPQHSETGALDVFASRTRRCGDARRGRGLRFSRRSKTASSPMDAAQRPRMAVPFSDGAAPPVETLSRPKPTLCSAGAGASFSRTILNEHRRAGEDRDPVLPGSELDHLGNPGRRCRGAGSVVRTRPRRATNASSLVHGGDRSRTILRGRSRNLAAADRSLSARHLSRLSARTGRTIAAQNSSDARRVRRLGRVGQHGRARSFFARSAARDLCFRADIASTRRIVGAEDAGGSQALGHSGSDDRRGLNRTPGGADSVERTATWTGADRVSRQSPRRLESSPGECAGCRSARARAGFRATRRSGNRRAGRPRKRRRCRPSAGAQFSARHRDPAFHQRCEPVGDRSRSRRLPRPGDQEEPADAAQSRAEANHGSRIATASVPDEHSE